MPLTKGLTKAPTGKGWRESLSAFLYPAGPRAVQLPDTATASRQVLRRALLLNAFAWLSEKYPGETRRVRRKIARAKASQEYRGIREQIRAREEWRKQQENASTNLVRPANIAEVQKFSKGIGK